MNKQEGIKELEIHKMKSEDIRADCYNDGINAGIAVMKKLDEPQKPVVPGFVAELLDYYRQSPDVDLLALLITFKDWYYSTAKDGDHEEAIDWLVKHPEIYMRAWLFGYEVEKESLYCVKIGKGYFSGFDETKVTYVIDDAPGALAQRVKYETREEAEMDAIQIGGTVEEVAE
ncbi:Uncharacterised protein [Enterococcus hirae]|uniref:DUF1642 domain-containing protein n=1 Tax=Enterococcus hirae TaxID=1354 RepID=UPI001956BD86|nr:DUF1642 domain-containing protein [Enterococcus hirae]VTX87783.1 Uncharacterised protein [Enterococcus hirae]